MRAFIAAISEDLVHYDSFIDDTKGGYTRNCKLDKLA
jgi:hypothetical protein